MTINKESAPLGKGQLRCFVCRQPCQMKDGSWEYRQNQQVFLCRICVKVSGKQVG